MGQMSWMGVILAVPQRSAVNVLVVDDDDLIRDIVCDTLRRAGYAVTGVAGVQDGLASLEKAGPDVVLTDIGLFDGSGMEILDTARDLSHPPEVILMSGSLEEAEYPQLRQAGVTDFLVKPFGLPELIDIVRATRNP